MPDGASNTDTYAYFRITEQRVFLSKFKVVEDGWSRSFSYSEMSGYASVSDVAVRSLAVRLTREINMARPPNSYDFDKGLRRNEEILRRARFGDYPDLKRLLMSNAVLPPEQVNELISGPNVEILDRLSRYLSSKSPIMR